MMRTIPLLGVFLFLTLTSLAEESISDTVKRAKAKASSPECAPIIESKKDFIGYMIDDDLKGFMRGGGSVIGRDLNGGATGPSQQRLEKLKAQWQTVENLLFPSDWEYTTEPKGFSGFLETAKTTATLETSCVFAETMAADAAWINGEKSPILEMNVLYYEKLFDAILKANAAKTSHQFTSFDDASATLAPLIVKSLVISHSFIYNPMEIKGGVTAVRLKIEQVLGDRAFLFSYDDSDVTGQVKFFYGYLPKNYVGPRDFVDGQFVNFVGEITGTHKYVSTIGAEKTVPSIRIYGIK